MPVSVREIQEAQRPLGDKIFEFLARNRGKAYATREIQMAMGMAPPLLTPRGRGAGEFFTALALNVLVAELSAEEVAEAAVQVNAALWQLMWSGQVEGAEYRGEFMFWAQAALPAPRVLGAGRP